MQLLLLLLVGLAMDGTHTCTELLAAASELSHTSSVKMYRPGTVNSATAMTDDALMKVAGVRGASRMSDSDDPDGGCAAQRGDERISRRNGTVPQPRAGPQHHIDSTATHRVDSDASKPTLVYVCVSVHM